MLVPGEGLVTPSIPPRVDYRLTELGASTVAPLLSLRRWAESHAAQVEENRRRYDAAAAER